MVGMLGASGAAPGNDGEVLLGSLSYQQVTGIRYYQGKETLKPKDEVVLKREPTNNFDQNAIAVHTSKASNPPPLSHLSLRLRRSLCSLLCRGRNSGRPH